MATVSLSDLTDMLEVRHAQLQQLVSASHLEQISLLIEDWKHYGQCLGLEDWQIRDADHKSSSKYGEKTLEMLKIWKKTVLDSATYLTLVKVCLDVDNAKLAGEICKLAKETPTSSQPHNPLTTTLSPSDEVAIFAQLEPGLLDQELSSDPAMLLSLVDVIPDWIEYSNALGLSDVERQALQTNSHLSDKMKCVEMLKRWHAVNGLGASYRKLVDAYLLLGDDGMAKELCRLLKGHLSKQDNVGAHKEAPSDAPSAPSSLLTADEVAESVGLSPNVLGHSFTDQHSLRLKIVKLVPDWYELATALSLTPVEKEWIQTDSSLSYMMKAMEVIKIWQKSNGSSAKYRTLIEAFLRLNNIDVAKKICEILVNDH